MANDMNLRIAYGAINLKTASGRLAAMRIKAPWDWDSASNTGKKSGAQFHNVNNDPNAKGFSSYAVSHPEGTVILLSGSRTRNSMLHAEGYIFLRLREEAAKLVIKFKIPTGQGSMLGGEMLAFQGNADILGVEELLTLGIVVPRRKQESCMDVEQIDELFEIEEVVPARSKVPELVRVATSDGVKLIAMAAEPVRRMRLRR